MSANAKVAKVATVSKNGKVANKKAEAKKAEKAMENLRVASAQLAAKALKAQKGSKLATTEAAQRAAIARLEAIAADGALKAELLQVACEDLQAATRAAADRLRARASNWEGFRV